MYIADMPIISYYNIRLPQSKPQFGIGTVPWLGFIIYMGLFNIAALRSGRISDIPFLAPSGIFRYSPLPGSDRNPMESGQQTTSLAPSATKWPKALSAFVSAPEKHRRRPIKIAL